ELFFQHAGLEAEYRVNRQEFERNTADLVDRTRALAEDLVKAARLSWREIDAIIPVGGSTRMPMVRRLIERFSDRGPRVYPLSPDFAISMGAALYAGICQSEKNQAAFSRHPQGKALAGFDTSVVSTHSLGILVCNQKGRRVVQTLIPKNTPLPV